MALHQMSANKGLVKFVKAPSKANSTNVVYRPRKSRKYNKKAQVAKSFRVAFHKMQPSKEIRYDASDWALNTSTSVATRTEYEFLDNIQQGTQLNQRLQGNIHMSWLHLQGTIQSNSGVKAKALRVMVLKETNYGSVDTTTFAALWRGTGSAVTYAPSGTQTDISWPVNREVAYPIYDKTIVIKPEYEGITVFRKKIKLNQIQKFPVNTGGTTPYLGRIVLVYCLADCDNLTSATSVVLQSSARVFFKDYHKAR